MAIRKTILATQIALALAVAYTNSYASDVEISLPAATDAFTIDQPAGTELMRVHGNGNVGIGTSTPEAALDIRGDSPTKAGINIRNNTAGGSGGLFIDDNAILSLGQPDVAQYLNINLLNSNVGIGTTNPASLLDIYGDTSSILTLRDGDAVVNEPRHSAGIHLKDGSDNITGFFGFGTSAEGLSIQNYNDDGGIHFSTGGNANQMVITANGNIGVGTQTTSDGTANGGQALKLDVEGAIGASNYCNERGENCVAAADLASGGTQKEYLDVHVLINEIRDIGTTTTEANFDLSTLGGVTVPAWATHAIVQGRSYVSQSGSFTGTSNSTWVKLSHNGTDFNPLTYASAYGSGQANRADDMNTQEVRIRNGNTIGFGLGTSSGGATGQTIGSSLSLIGFAGY